MLTLECSEMTPGSRGAAEEETKLQVCSGRLVDVRPRERPPQSVCQRQPSCGWDLPSFVEDVGPDPMPDPTECEGSEGLFLK